MVWCAVSVRGDRFGTNLCARQKPDAANVNYWTNEIWWTHFHGRWNYIIIRQFYCVNKHNSLCNQIFAYQTNNIDPSRQTNWKEKKSKLKKTPRCVTYKWVCTCWIFISTLTIEFAMRKARLGMATTGRRGAYRVRVLPPQLANARARPFFGFRACDKVSCTNTTNVRPQQQRKKNLMLL